MIDPSSEPSFERAAQNNTADVFACGLCGLAFTHGLQACGSCALGASCLLVRCPRCGYEFPREASGLVRLFKRWTGWKPRS